MTIKRTLLRIALIELNKAIFREFEFAYTNDQLPRTQKRYLIREYLLSNLDCLNGYDFDTIRDYIKCEIEDFIDKSPFKYRKCKACGKYVADNDFYDNNTCSKSCARDLEDNDPTGREEAMEDIRADFFNQYRG